MLTKNFIDELLGARPEWTERKALYELATKRALLLKNRLNQGITINNVVKQSLVDVRMQIADQSEIPFYSTGFMILRSEKKIPTLIAQHTRHAFMAVRDARVLSTKFNVVSQYDAVYAGHGKVNSRLVFCFTYNDYLYIKLSKDNPKITLLDNLIVEGVFEDPIEAILFNEPTLIGRELWDKEYPLNLADWNYVKEMILGDGNKVRGETEG